MIITGANRRSLATRVVFMNFSAVGSEQRADHAMATPDGERVPVPPLQKLGDRRVDRRRRSPICVPVTLVAGPRRRCASGSGVCVNDPIVNGIGWAIVCWRQTGPVRANGWRRIAATETFRPLKRDSKQWCFSRDRQGATAATAARPLYRGAEDRVLITLRRRQSGGRQRQLIHPRQPGNPDFAAGSPPRDAGATG